MTTEQYGILCDGVWWQWFEDGVFTHLLSLQTATDACELLNQTSPHLGWEVKINDRELAVDLPEGETNG